MIDKIFLQRRIERVRGYYNDLTELLAMADGMSRKIFFYYAVERVIQLIVDEVIDMNNHLISALAFSVPDDFQSTFRVLADNNIVSEKLAERLAPIVGLRNRLVHRYETVDRELMLRMIGREKEDIQDYVAVIERMVERNGD
ncbi:DUF86 domain-containing protein [Candidatus Uhrbacteria bacterium]|nr:DUF86 domain-containing protein [Candidatus Uhrbacteria bacterium]